MESEKLSNNNNNNNYNVYLFLFILFYYFATQNKLLWWGNLREAKLKRNRGFPKCIIRKLTNLFYTPQELFLTHLFETGKCTNKKLIITFSAVEKILYSHVYVPQKL